MPDNSQKYILWSDAGLAAGFSATTEYGVAVQHGTFRFDARLVSDVTLLLGKMVGYFLLEPTSWPVEDLTMRHAEQDVIGLRGGIDPTRIDQGTEWEHADKFNRMVLGFVMRSEG